MSGCAPDAIAARKAAARAAAFERRRVAHEMAWASAGLLSSVLAGHRGAPIAGYMAMRTEIDPAPAMEEAAAHGPVGVPIILGQDHPLEFHRWLPGCATRPGPFGALIPVDAERMVPEIVIVPLVAFDRRGGRLGYGGGFYDRTLALLRAHGPVLAIGFAYAAQESDELPLEPTDQPLDMIVTEREIIEP
ncbi:5-formyltetrahydrofolate cyclo-ligase family protein [Oceanicola granulosus HTCC2516]|uniref:5-formyltetrahydrofolate cyclo-ligase n=1 Tax=Oceanicola granulosus (strain ATCC BAA-861 / DSM 15982 / KCTC 12143 / HTCC2516) TaxID=314256 RepID=Q2CDU8_OCEGH|nr:5-formyltetrahydrofolate cyclo-ligase [Oceanicola granulosus]EAR50880.1 5-formyltetrahydrofolate cyclo-ligase family protein [Oceanicola granulosus HTCC2516]